MPKALFTLALVSFMFPFLLITCNDTSTIEYKPMIFQDQYVYPMQGYKLAFGIDDKSQGLFGEKQKSKQKRNINSDLDFSNDDEADDSKEKLLNGSHSSMTRSYDKDAVYWQIILIALMLVSFSGLLFSFLNKRLGYSNFNLKILSIAGMSLLLLFNISIYFTENKIHTKTQSAFKKSTDNNWLESLDNLEIYIGFGSGVYLCFFAYLLLLLYFYYFSKRFVFKLERTQPQIISFDTNENVEKDDLRDPE